VVPRVSKAMNKLGTQPSRKSMAYLVTKSLQTNGRDRPKNF
jgi:hypothetical protein